LDVYGTVVLEGIYLTGVLGRLLRTERFSFGFELVCSHTIATW